MLKLDKLWLVVSTHLKNMSQIGKSSFVGGKHEKYLKPPPRTDSVDFVVLFFSAHVPCRNLLFLSSSSALGPSKILFHTERHHNEKTSSLYYRYFMMVSSHYISQDLKILQSIFGEEFLSRCWFHP